ncbi:MAG TPA: hypothetical protein VNW95_09250 [Mucilaginibacter sp.]|jgi:hypothetical protein|nr:hypothetical protein [Mucilaginibacter sp.]
MEQKEFIEVFVGVNPVMVSISSIASVEKVGTGSTIILKEKAITGNSHYIETNVSYYTIKGWIENYQTK